MTRPPTQPEITGYYLSRKVPWNLMKKAMTLGGPALCVYLACWTLFHNRKTEIQLRRDFFDNTGLAGSSISKALKHLIGAGLINEIRRERGKLRSLNWLLIKGRYMPNSERTGWRDQELSGAASEMG